MDYVDTQRYILAFKAGRALRRDATNFVDPKPEKGAIILYDGEDDLLHFVWKDRTTGSVVEVRITLASNFYRSPRFTG
jgi:26S proteasome regulatory subunit N13